MSNQRWGKRGWDWIFLEPHIQKESLAPEMPHTKAFIARFLVLPFLGTFLYPIEMY